MRYPNPFFKQRFIQGIDTVKPQDSTFRPRQWLVARSLCYFKEFNLKSVDPKERRNALQVKILQWSPFQETGKYILYHGDKACVWIWDDTVVQNGMYAQGVTVANVMPETLLLGSKKEDGFRLVQCMEGYEGQLWEDGVITSSRWWPTFPEERQLQLFFMSNDLPPQEDYAVEEAAYLSRPWTRRFNVMEMFNIRSERFWVKLGTVAVVFLLSYFGYRYYVFSQYSRDYSRRLSAVQDEVAPIRAAQNRINGIYNKYAVLVETVRGFSQLQLLSDVHKRLPEISAFAQWQFTGETLQFIAPVPGLKPLDIVSRLQENEIYSNISVDTYENTMYAVTMQVSHESL